MPSCYKLKNHLTKKTLFEGSFPSLRACVEKAVELNTDLTEVDLSFANLSNAAMDNAYMPRSVLKGANLTGTNLSEATLDYSDFTDSALYNACLCLSSLTHCRFLGASFGATDIAGAIISGATFSTLSALNLDFFHAFAIKNCFFSDSDGKRTSFSKPPIVINGIMNTPVVIFENCIHIGTTRLPVAASGLIEALKKTIQELNPKGETGKFLQTPENHGKSSFA